MNSSRLRVLVADSLASEDLAPLREMGVEVVEQPTISAADLERVIPDYDGLLVRSRTQVTRQLLGMGPRLKVVGRAGTGVDNVDVAAATEKGILVMNVPGGNAVAAAEHTLAVLFALARQIPRANQSLREGHWDRKTFVGFELTGKTIGVLGLGKIGQEVASRAVGLKMRVLAYDPQLSSEAIEDKGLIAADLATLFAESDVITVHVPLLPSTTHLLDARAFAQMKRGVTILNVARGGIVHEGDLLTALHSGQVGSAGLDVFEVEPPQCTELLAHPRVVATPHLGASTTEAQSGVSRAIADQVCTYFRDGSIVNAVNLPGSGSMQPEALPWKRLARRLGGLASGLKKGGIRGLELTVVGEGVPCDETGLLREALVGLLAPFSDHVVNVVNAEGEGRARGFSFSVLKRAKHPAFQAMLRVKLEDEGEGLVLDGTLFGNNNLRIVRAYGCNMDAIPEGPMLWVCQEDVPGIIAHISAVLSDVQINIDNMSVGRTDSGNLAMAVLNLRESPTEVALRAIADHPSVKWVKLLSKRVLST